MKNAENAIQLSEEQAQRLIQLYEAAERDLLNEINRGLLGPGTLKYKKTMLANVQNILKGLENGSRTWCEEVIPHVYSNGAKNADAQMEALNASAGIAFGGIHQQAAQVLAENTFSRLQDVNQVIGRQVDDVIRQVSMDAIRGTIVHGDSVTKTAKKIQQQLAEQGITGFKDARGRQWNMKNYATMLARTSTMEAFLAGTHNRLLEHGHDLVQVSWHPNACDLCAPYQDKILSLTGENKDYTSLEQAKANGLFHPNCKHAYSISATTLEDDGWKKIRQEKRDEMQAKADAAAAEKKAQQEAAKEREKAAKQKEKEKEQRKTEREAQQEAKRTQEQAKKEGKAGNVDTEVTSRGKVKNDRFKTVKQADKIKGEAIPAKDLPKAGEAKTVEEAQGWAKAAHGIKTDYTGYTPQMANKLNLHIQNMSDRLGVKVGDFVPSIDTETGDSKALGFTFIEDRSLHLNLQKLNDSPERIGAWKMDQMLRYHPLDTPITSVITHESGHALHFKLAELEGVDAKELTKSIKKATMKEAGMTNADIEKFLSGYAKASPEEFFAEAFAEWMDSPTPRHIAQAFGKVISPIIEKYKASGAFTTTGGKS